MFDRCYVCARMLNTVAVTLLAGKASYVVLLFGALLLGIQTTLLRAEDTPQLLTPELGEPLHPSDIENYEITIFPNGKNLPEGQGTVAQGEVLYQTQCATCHGKKGIEGPAARLAGSDGWFSFRDPLRVLRIRKHPVLLISVGSMWPFATTIFDYIRRAMPHQAPKSLNNDEVYALTAYILHLNDLLNTATQLDKHSILEINMPGKARSVIAD